MEDNIPKPIGEERIISQGKIIELVHQDMQVGDKVITFERARRAPGVRLIFISPEKKILLTKEYRTELEGWDYRLPGGKVFDRLEDYNLFLSKEGDLLKEAIGTVARESEEEVGLLVTNPKHYYTSKCGATVDWDLYYFIIKKYENDPTGQTLEYGENIEIGWFEINEVKELILEGKMHEDRSSGVLLRYIESITERS